MNSEKFKHVILTRFNTKEDNEGKLLYDKPGANKWMDHRVQLFKETQKSVLEQTCGNFEWVISMDERTPERYLKKIDSDYRIKLVSCNILDAFVGREVDTPWVITTRLDCDDIIMPGFVHAVQRQFQPKLKVIDVGVVRLNWDTQKVHAGNVGRGRSMFISLVENSERVVTVFCRPHAVLHLGYPMTGVRGSFGEYISIPVDQINKPRAVMVCHGENEANYINSPYMCDWEDFKNANY